MAAEGGNQQARQEDGAFDVCFQYFVEHSFFAMALGIGAGGGHADQRNMDLDAARGLIYSGF